MIAHVQLSDDEAALVMREASNLAADRIMADALLTRQQAADSLGVTTATLNKLKIKRVKIGSCTRYRIADLKAYIDGSLE